MRALGFLIGAAAVSVAGGAWAADINAGPGDYKAKAATLQPGDTLVLQPGDYTDGLRLEDISGAEGMPITIAGPSDGMPARFVGRSCCNTIDLRNAAYITIRNILFDGNGELVDAIKAGGTSGWTHHITIEDCRITNHSGGETNQQIVGISTKIVSWDWVVRRNVIDGAGTGIYFGNSNGAGAFIGGLVEGNLFLDTLGYNMQVKHQIARDAEPGVPQDVRTLIVRHNVFIKSNNPSPSGGRPNLLVSGYPDSGAGSDDHVEIYGNFFYFNDEDSLLQASGRVHIHDNIFVKSANSAIRHANHQGKLVIDALVYNNTIYDTGRGINFSSAPNGTSLVAGNAIFSPQPLTGVGAESDNITDSVANAGMYVVQPSTTLGAMDFYPTAALSGTAIDLSSVSSDVDYDRDFNGTAKDFTFRGAYSGTGDNPGWKPDATKKPLPSGGSGGTGGSSGSGGSSASSGGANAATTGNGSGGSTGSGDLPGGCAEADGCDDGCSCETPGRPASPHSDLALLGLLLGASLRRRRS